MADEDFYPMPPSTEVSSGSLRHRRGFDRVAGCEVTVMEFLGMFDNGDGRGRVLSHRMSAIWDNDEVREFDLAGNVVIYDPREDDMDKCDAAKDYARLMDAIEAVRDEA